MKTDLKVAKLCSYFIIHSINKIIISDFAYFIYAHIGYIAYEPV